MKNYSRKGGFMKKLVLFMAVVTLVLAVAAPAMAWGSRGFRRPYLPPPIYYGGGYHGCVNPYVVGAVITGTAIVGSAIINAAVAPPPPSLPAPKISTPLKYQCGWNIDPDLGKIWVPCPNQ